MPLPTSEIRGRGEHPISAVPERYPSLPHRINTVRMPAGQRPLIPGNQNFQLPSEVGGSGEPSLV